VTDTFFWAGPPPYIWDEYAVLLGFSTEKMKKNGVSTKFLDKFLFIKKVTDTFFGLGRPGGVWRPVAQRLLPPLHHYR
jgi:hypothetical protein